MRKKKYVKVIVVLLMTLILNEIPNSIIVNAEEYSDSKLEKVDKSEENVEEGNSEESETDEKADDIKEDENVDTNESSDLDKNQEAISDEPQRTDRANSWRYKDGELIESGEEDIVTFSGRVRSVTPWSNINGNFYNSFGDRIDGVVAKGIDVSEHNGDIDWARVKNTDVNYAILRCGYGDDFSFQDDKKWQYNVSKCEQLGIPYGVYIYSYATSIEQAQSEAQHVLRLVNGHSLSYPIYLDLEEESVRQSVSTEKIAQIAKTFCDTIQASGYRVGIYANTNWFTTYLTNSQFNNYIKWVAQYNYECEYQGNYTMWQCTSKGSVDGIAGNVDLNMDFGTISENANNNSEVRQNIPEQVYTIGTALDNSKILSVESASTENYKKIVLGNIANIDGYKQFEIRKIKDGWYRIEVGSTGKVLEGPSNYGELQVPVQQNRWNGSEGQLWSFIDAGDGYYYIKSKMGVYLDLVGANTSEGNYIQTYTLNKTNAQKWKLDSTIYGRTVEDGIYTINAARDNQKVLDLSGGSLANGGNIQIYASNGTAAQKYQITYLENGYYKITIEKSGKSLDVTGGSRSSGANLQQYQWNGTDAQLWRFVDAGGGRYYIKSKLGTVLDIYGGQMNSGTNVWMYEWNGTDAQKWNLQQSTSSGEPVQQTIQDGTYVISSSLTENKVLDLYGGSLSNGANIQIYASNGTAAQKYQITYIGDGYYKIIIEKTGKSLDVYGGKSEAGVNLQQYGWNGTDAQLWRFVDAGNGYYYIQSKLGTVLDVWGGKTTSGTNVWMYSMNNTKAQKWKLKKL